MDASNGKASQGRKQYIAKVGYDVQLRANCFRLEPDFAGNAGD